MVGELEHVCGSARQAREMAVQYVLIGLLALALAGLGRADARAAGRSFEECQARAVALGIHIKRTGRVAQQYQRYKAAGSATNPRGFMARCLAGKD
jgi:hypothetical protein